MDTLYGTITSEQFDEYRKKLHKKLFWLLLYKDPKTCDEFKCVNLNRYMTTLMKEINGLSQILSNPAEIVEMLSLLQAALNETKADVFDYMSYRKFVLDAHTILDRMEV